LPPLSPPDLNEIFPDKAPGSKSGPSDFADYELGDLSGLVDTAANPAEVVVAQPSLDVPVESMQSFFVHALITVPSCEEHEGLTRAATESLNALSSRSFVLQVRAHLAGCYGEHVLVIMINATILVIVHTVIQKVQKGSSQKLCIGIWSMELQCIAYVQYHANLPTIL
jgi:hypothetical protein